jgi:hypothetical protein
METQEISAGQTPVVPEIVAAVIEGGAKKKPCKKGTRRGSDGRCHRVSLKRSPSDRRSSRKRPSGPKRFKGRALGTGVRYLW